MTRPPAIVLILVLVGACSFEPPTAKLPSTPERVSPPQGVVEPGSTSEVPKQPQTTPDRSTPPPPGGQTCDVTGTWRLNIIAGEASCAALQDEHIDLALAFVAGAARPTLASAAKPSVAAGTIGRLLPSLRAAPVNAPGLPCGVRLELGPAGQTHAELLLAREGDGLHGVGTVWARKGDKRCSEHFQVVSARTAEAPEPWSALIAAPPATLVAPTPASPESAAAVARVSARSLLDRSVKSRPAVKLTGSIVEYVQAVLDQPGAVRLYEVACTAEGEQDARCVAVVGDPCAPGGFEGEECEGMFLTVVVNTSTGKLDRADSGRYPVESHADIEARLEMAP